ncbi:MAG TPA: C4-dicarboxylate ABC transporter, partial [Thermoanaerobaculia bacterium]|nr:C4-dicarboxylate ABC transporter [Thermoanaerobaculia bacterium]
MIARLAGGIRTLHPAYFALVMATGIVSIAAALLRVPFVPRALLAVNVVAFAVLWALTAVRLGRHPREMLLDLADHQRGVGFFTVVAGTSVLGSQLAIVAGAEALALGFWVATVA